MAQLGGCGTGSSITNQNCCVNDGLCCTVTVQSDDPQTAIWTNSTNFTINGTVLVENNGQEGSPSVNVFVDGTTPGPIAPGECRALTVEDLNSIQIAPVAGGTGSTEVVVSWSLNYCFECV